MSLLGAIKTYYAESEHAKAEALRTALGGSDKIYADLMPGSPASPYCLLAETNTAIVGNARDYPYNSARLEVTVTFAVFGRGREEVEDILEALEDCYLHKDAALSVANRTHTATTFGNRFSYHDSPHRQWRGTLELIYRLTKSSS